VQAVPDAAVQIFVPDAAVQIFATCLIFRDRPQLDFPEHCNFHKQ
jgi:hypothetical protein